MTGGGYLEAIEVFEITFHVAQAARQDQSPAISKDPGKQLVSFNENIVSLAMVTLEESPDAENDTFLLVAIKSAQIDLGMEDGGIAMPTYPQPSPDEVGIDYAPAVTPQTDVSAEPITKRATTRRKGKLHYEE